MLSSPWAGRSDHPQGQRRHDAVLRSRAVRRARSRPRPAADVETPAPPPALGAAILDAYVGAAPSPQLAIDLFPGEWSSRFPEELGVTAGAVPLFADDRITWLLEQTGDLTGRTVLELGPWEGGHTYQLGAAGASVTAIEANTRAYLKCLLAKELLGMTNCRFMLGNFVAYLQQPQHERFDMVLASGVLYHSTDPLRLLELMAGAADRLGLWTHYFEPEVVRSTPSVARHFGSEPLMARFRGREVALHRRDYLDALEWNGFCGGPEDHALWLERDDLLACLELLGFTDVRLGDDDPSHVNGPCLLVYAQR